VKTATASTQTNTRAVGTCDFGRGIRLKLVRLDGDGGVRQGKMNWREENINITRKWEDDVLIS
jgi:hypothetical protein